MKRIIHTTLQGHRIEYDQPDAKLGRFLKRAESLAEDEGTTEDDLVALIYSDQNPLLEPSPVGGAPLVTKETLAHPCYRVLTDLLERVRVRERGIDVGKLAAGYTWTVAEAAEELGVHESAVRQAIKAGRLPSWVKDGRLYLHPKWTRQFGEQTKGNRRGPKAHRISVEPGDYRVTAAPLDIRVGNAPGTSFRVKFPEARFELDSSDHHARTGVVENWKQVGVISGGAGRYRFFVLEPSDEENAIEFGEFYVRGRFTIAEKVNNARKAREGWDAFQPS